MHDFIYKDDICTINEYDGNGRKKTKKKKQGKIPRFVILIYDIEADCFLISESAENKPDIS